MNISVLRPLSPAERWFWIADQLSTLNVVARVHLEGHLPAEALKRAAATLASEHPLLRVSIATDAEGAHPTFIPSSEGIPVDTVHTTTTLGWEHYIDQYELTTPVNWHNGPLIRITDIVCASRPESHDLLLTVPHVIGDGTTALTLLQRLVAHATTGRNSFTARRLIGAAADLLPDRHRGSRCLPRLVAAGLAEGFTAALLRPQRLTPEYPADSMRRNTRLVRRMLTSTELDGLVRRCRHKGVTVHGALTAAMVMAIGPGVARNASGRIRIGTPIDFRSELDPPVSTDEVGSYVNAVPTVVRFGGDRDLWSIARRVNRSLGRQRRSGRHLTLLWGLRFVCPRSLADSTRVFRLVERNGPLNVAISNVGRYQFAERIGDWRMSGAQFFCSVPPTGSFLATITTSDGQLFWNFTYAERMLSQHVAGGWADGCVATLLGAIS